MISYSPTPLQPLNLTEAGQRGIKIMVKREDLNHQDVSGNKWWKIKYNLEEARIREKKTLLTFGGAFSNHIYATAAACHEAGLKSIGVIRGERTAPLNATLQFAADHGMHLHFISRGNYKLKSAPDFIASLHGTFGDFYLVPEGGSNAPGIRGCMEFAEKILSQLTFDYLILPVGTGATMAGIILGLRGRGKIIGVPVLKDGGFLKHEIENYLSKFPGPLYGNWELLTSYHYGGYAKVTAELARFIVMMQAEHNLPLDPVYAGKMMLAVLTELKNGFFPDGTTVLILHTGGLQGAAQLYPKSQRKIRIP